MTEELAPSLLFIDEIAIGPVCELVFFFLFVMFKFGARHDSTSGDEPGIRRTTSELFN